MGSALESPSVRSGLTIDAWYLKSDLTRAGEAWVKHSCRLLHGDLKRPDDRHQPQEQRRYFAVTHSGLAWESRRVRVYADVVAMGAVRSCSQIERNN